VPGPFPGPGGPGAPLHPSGPGGGPQGAVCPHQQQGGVLHQQGPPPFGPQHPSTPTSRASPPGAMGMPPGGQFPRGGPPPGSFPGPGGPGSMRPNLGPPGPGVYHGGVPRSTWACIQGSSTLGQWKGGPKGHAGPGPGPFPGGGEMFVEFDEFRGPPQEVPASLWGPASASLSVTAAQLVLCLSRSGMGVF